MSVLTIISGIPLYSTVQEAKAWAKASGLGDHVHVHDFQEQTGYMGGASHTAALQAVKSTTTTTRTSWRYTRRSNRMYRRQTSGNGAKKVTFKFCTNQPDPYFSTIEGKADYGLMMQSLGPWTYGYTGPLSPCFTGNITIAGQTPQVGDGFKLVWIENADNPMPFNFQWLSGGNVVVICEVVSVTPPDSCPYYDYQVATCESTTVSVEPWAVLNPIEPGTTTTPQNPCPPALSSNYYYQTGPYAGTVNIEWCAECTAAGPGSTFWIINPDCACCGFSPPTSPIGG